MTRYIPSYHHSYKKETEKRKKKAKRIGKGENSFDKVKTNGTLISYCCSQNGVGLRNLT